MNDGTLRERLVRLEAERVRENLAPVLGEMRRAATLIGRNAETVAEVVCLLRRDRWERLLCTVLVGALLLLVTFFVAIPSLDRQWVLTDDELRRLRIGEQIETVWESLTAAERTVLENALR